MMSRKGILFAQYVLVNLMVGWWLLIKMLNFFSFSSP